MTTISASISVYSPSGPPISRFSVDSLLLISFGALLSGSLARAEGGRTQQHPSELPRLTSVHVLCGFGLAVTGSAPSLSSKREWLKSHTLYFYGGSFWEKMIMPEEV